MEKPPRYLPRVTRLQEPTWAVPLGSGRLAVIASRELRGHHVDAIREGLRGLAGLETVGAGRGRSLLIFRPTDRLCDVQVVERAVRVELLNIANTAGAAGQESKVNGSMEIIADLEFEETVAAVRSSDGKAVLLFRHEITPYRLSEVVQAIQAAGGVIASTGRGAHAAVVTVAGLDLVALRHAARPGFIAAADAAAERSQP